MLLLDLGPLLIFGSIVILAYLLYGLSKIQDSEDVVAEDCKINRRSLTSKAIFGLGNDPPDFSLLSLMHDDRDR